MTSVKNKFSEYKKKRKIIEYIVKNINDLDFNKNEQTKFAKLAIIVPFRDNKFQNRSQQLKEFIPTMTKYLNNGIKKYNIKREFNIFVIEQSDDKKGFNRGQLLNIGFNLIRDKYDYVIFHDVDLIPQKLDSNGDNDGVKWYLFNPIKKPIHIGGGWIDKYNFYTFVGGAFSISVKDNIKVNGFPNNFWGWGGEDDVFYNRMALNGIVFIKPAKAFLKEMFHKPTDKIRELVMNKSVKMKKVMDDLVDNKWKNNGVNSLKNIKVKSRKNIDNECVIINVQLDNV